MKTFTFLSLMSASLAQALPMRIGNTWTWSVRGLGSDTSTNWQTATVVGSAKHDSGIAWTLSVRDSQTRSSDTSIVVERPDKSKAWLAGSPKFALEFEPWNGSMLELRNATTPLAPWGLKSFQPDFWNRARGYDYTLQPAAGGPSNGWMDFSYFEGAATGPIPHGIWIDTVGPVVFRNLAREGKTYRMLFHNRRAIDLAPYLAKSHTPPTGTALAWEERVQSGWLSSNSDSGRSTLHHWTFLGSLPDSSEWIQWRVRDSSVDDSGRVKDSTQELRIPLRDWISTARRGGCPTPEDAWLTDWSDSVTAGGILRISAIGTRSSGAGINLQRSEVFEKIAPGHQFDSASCVRQTYQVGLRIQTTTRVLISVDGRQVRTPRITAGSPRTGRAKGSLPFRSLADLPPGLAVRWSDAHGRVGSLRAGEAGTLSRICLHGAVLLRATLPDGSAWSGSMFVP